MFGSRKNSKREKCSKMPQNPTRRVHALLGAVELEDSLAKKRRHCQLTEILTHNLIFGNWQKAWFTKTPNNQKPWTTKKNCLEDSLAEWKLCFVRTSNNWKPTLTDQKQNWLKNLQGYSWLSDCETSGGEINLLRKFSVISINSFRCGCLQKCPLPKGKEWPQRWACFCERQSTKSAAPFFARQFLISKILLPCVSFVIIALFLTLPHKCRTWFCICFCLWI